MPYRIYITTGDFDEEKFPIPPKRVKPSAKVCKHTPHPTTYHAQYEWSELAAKTHAQVRCPRCGLWAIWLPKAEAKRINAHDRKEERAFTKKMMKHWGPTGEQRYKREVAAAKKRGEI